MGPSVHHDNDNRIKRIGPWLPSRSAAKISGTKYYFTGKPCKHGHIDVRTVSSGCVECSYLSCKEREAADPNAKKERSRKRYHDNAIAENERNKRWRDENPEKHKAINAKWRAENLEYNRARVREYTRLRYLNDSEFREWKYAKNRERRAISAGNGGRHTAKDIADILKRQRYRCAECGVSVRTKKNRHVDHIMPLALGGTNWPANIQVLCPPCNLSKGAQHPIVFAQRKGRLL